MRVVSSDSPMRGVLHMTWRFWRGWTRRSLGWMTVGLLGIFVSAWGSDARFTAILLLGWFWLGIFSVAIAVYTILERLNGWRWRIAGAVAMVIGYHEFFTLHRFFPPRVIVFLGIVSPVGVVLLVMAVLWWVLDTRRQKMLFLTWIVGAEDNEGVIRAKKAQPLSQESPGILHSEERDSRVRQYDPKHRNGEGP